MERELKFWEQEQPESFDDLVRVVGIEGYERLFVQRTEHIFDESDKWAIERGLPEKDSHNLENFHFSARLEAVTMAVQLGYALALTQRRLGSFEDWLQAAIAAAGLAGYTPNIKHYIFGKEGKEDQQ